MRTFGEWMAYYRHQSIDPQNGKHLTQKRVLDLLAEYDPTQLYTPGQLSKWESGERKISWQLRDRLLAFVYVFAQCQGLKSKEEANEFLASGGYAPLDEDDLEQLPFEGFEYEKDKEEGVDEDGIYQYLKDIIDDLRGQLEASKGAEQKLLDLEQKRLRSIANISQTQRKILELVPTSTPILLGGIFEQIEAKGEYIGEMSTKEVMLRLHELMYLELVGRKRNANNKWIYWRLEPELKISKPNIDPNRTESDQTSGR